MNARIALIPGQLRRMLGLAIVLVAMLHQTARAVLPGVQQSAVNPANSHTYYLLDNSNWSDAESAAILLGGHLATINDLAENNWIWNQWGTNRNLWIGFNDAAVEGTFVWASGESPGYTNWRPGEPNDGNFGEDYAYILAKGQVPEGGVWNDYADLATVPPQPDLFGVVEVIPEPTTGALLIAGCLMGFLYRKKPA